MCSSFFAICVLCVCVICFFWVTDSSFFHEFEVKILCHLHHDQLRAVFHVSQRIRKAVSTSLSLYLCLYLDQLWFWADGWSCLYCCVQVVIARQFHFNYTTPDRSRQEMLRTITPQPTEHWPFVRWLSQTLKLCCHFLLNIYFCF